MFFEHQIICDPGAQNQSEVAGYICSYSQKYIVWVKIIHFNFMPKIIRTLRSCSMKIFSKFRTVNIAKLNFWLAICIAKNFIWTTLKQFSEYLDFFAPSDSRCSDRCISAKYCPIITTHTSMKRLFIQLSDDIWISNSKKLTLKTGFVAQGHILE